MTEQRKHGIDYRFALIGDIMCRCGRKFPRNGREFRRHLEQHGDDGPITN